MNASVFYSLRRYGLATLAPSLVSGSQFILQLILLRKLTDSEFGLVAFILTLVQFGYGVSNALISTPYTVTINQGCDARTCQMFFLANIVFAAGWSWVCGGCAWALGEGRLAPWFGLLGFLAMMRWFGRAHLYAMHRPLRAALSDISYSVTLLSIVGVASLLSIDLLSTVLIFCGALIMGLGTIGIDFGRSQFSALRGGSLRSYAAVWKEQSRWTMLGVATTEATANAHSYLVTFFAGPVAFAPLAAAALFMKPVSLVVSSLTQLERPVMARAIGCGDYSAALQATSLFRLSVLVAWGCTLCLAIGVILFQPALVFKPSYDLNVVVIAFCFWAFISLLQSWSTPDSVLLQGTGAFRSLAFTSVYSAIVSLVGVAVFIVLIGPLYSLAGILAGQALMSYGIVRLAREWRTSLTPRFAQ